MWNITLDSTESTNDDLRAAYEAGAENGAWIRALSQTKGRGRHEREWVSQPGNLYFSYLLRENRLGKSGELMSWVPLQAAVLIAETLNPFMKEKIFLKWPNDLFVKNENGFGKVGGILCEGIFSEKELAVIIGVGINVFSAPSLEDRKTAKIQFSKIAGTGKMENAESIFESILAKLKQELKILHETNRSDSRDEIQMWKNRFLNLSLFKKGDLVSWKERHDSLGEAHNGRFHDLGSQGQLVVQIDDHNTKGTRLKELYSEEVSIPFFADK